MTTDAALAPDQDERMFCFRHPDRETWIRCGRCDKPICTQCGLMGPVGMRCRDCGRLRNDPLTSFSPTQLVLGVGAALGAGTIGGLIGLQMGGFFALLIGFFGGGLIGEAVLRVTGYKRGPVMQAIVIGGIVGGALIALAYQYWSFASLGGEAVMPFQLFVNSVGIWALVWIGAAIAGAWSRIR